MRFTDLLSSAERSAGNVTLDVPEDWRQGRAVFGGLQSALGASAMRDLVPAELPLRSLQTTFLAPPAGPRITARARVLRRGKSAVHVMAWLRDADAAPSSEESEGALALLVGVFGAPRPSAVRVAPVQPRVPSDTPTPFRYVPGVTPTFTQHFDATWLTGALPFSGSEATTASVRLGMPEETACSEGLVVALSDFIPPLGLAMLRTPAPGSSLTWLLELLDHDLERLPMSGFRVDAELVAGRDGYHNQSTTLWAPDGTPLALSRQTMVVFG